MANIDDLAGQEDFAHSDVPQEDTADSLRSLLAAIVNQLNDADQRQTETLAQLQNRLEDRLDALTREAEALKSSIPPNLAGAMERIENGLLELGVRISETRHAAETDAPTAPLTPAETDSGFIADAPAHAFADQGSDEIHQSAPPEAEAADTSATEPEKVAGVNEPPAALRSGLTIEYSKPGNAASSLGIDPFEVIGSRGDDDEDPWDRDAAQALTGLYESGAATFTAAPDYAAPAAQPSSTEDRVSANASPAAGVSGSTIDNAWMEARFNDIAERIEATLNDIRPDKEFFALGQRIDSLEEQIARAVETIQAGGGSEGLNVVEAHIGELASYLEGTNTQLNRLEAIEAQLAVVAERLDEVHAIARNAAEGSGEAMPAVDVDAIARAAAAEIGSQFSGQVGQDGYQLASEIRDSLNAFMGERRQGEEAIASALEMLQQAVGNLLDRADAMEQRQMAPMVDNSHADQIAETSDYEAPVADYVASRRQSAPAPDMGLPEYDPSGVDDSEQTYESGPVVRRPAPKPAHDVDAADNPQAAFETAAEHGDVSDAPLVDDHGGYAPSQNEDEMQGQRTAAQMRQDFIAEARRAKMRLAAETPASESQLADAPSNSAPQRGNVSDIRSQLLNDDAQSGPAVARPGSPRGRGDARQQKAAKAAGAPSQRLVVLGMAALVAMGGLWYALDKPASRGSAIERAAIAGGEGRSAAPVASGKIAPSDSAPTSGSEIENQSSGDPAGADGELAPPMPDFETRGEIIPGDIVVGQSSVLLPGITIDAERELSPDALDAAKRRQALASMSTSLGQAAARMVNEVPTPRSLAPGLEAAQPAAHSPTLPEADNMATSTRLDMPPAAIGPLSLRLAAANGDPSAEFNVGARFAEGNGVAQDFKQAAKWYQRAAVRGFAQAQYRLGTLYERGLGVRTDAKQAVTWYKAAAAQGNVKAMHNLAVLKANSSDGSPDYMAAAQLFEKAANYGLSDSQYNLAILYENGLGVAKDLSVAYKWLSLAAQSGDADTRNRLENLKGRLSVEDLAKAERLVASFRPKPRDRVINDARVAGEAWKTAARSGRSG